MREAKVGIIIDMDERWVILAKKNMNKLPEIFVKEQV